MEGANKEDGNAAETRKEFDDCAIVLDSKHGPQRMYFHRRYDYLENERSPEDDEFGEPFEGVQSFGM